MYAHLRDPSRWVLSEVVAWQARERGPATFIETIDGEALSFAEAEAQGERMATFLAAEGVGSGDKVVVMLPNGLDFVRVWLGLGRLGAVFVVLNTGLSGPFLAHQIRSSGASLAVLDAAFLPTFGEIADAVPNVTKLVMAGGSPASGEAAPPWPIIDFAAWGGRERYGGPMPAFSDTACIAYTSGTTGPAKGVLMPHAHCFLFGLGAIDHLALEPSDRYYVTLPLFHANGLFMQVYACLIAGATAILRQRFSASAWLDDIRRCGATLTNMIGVMAQFVIEQPPTPRDRDHQLRGVMSGPYLPEQDAIFRGRFGVPGIFMGFGMTEMNIALWGTASPTSPAGCAGRVYERYFEVEIRDPDTDAPKAPGELGEIMVRPRVGFGFMAGYDGLPEKTCEAWRNLWFHTGDAGFVDVSGEFVFTDRIKDCIRRRGENISSTEVESAMQALDGVSEVAAYAVRSDIAGGEDEVMLALVAPAEAGLTAEAAAAHADRVLPRFARPRFIEIMPELPKTPTGKIRKAELRKRGVTAQTWDRDVFGAPTSRRPSRGASG